MFDGYMSFGRCDSFDRLCKSSECNGFGKRVLFEVIRRKSQTDEMNLIQGIILEAFLLWHCFYCKNTSVYKKEETKHDEHYLTSIRNHIRSSELSELSFTAVSTCGLFLK